MTIPWSEKYRPDTLAEFVDNGKALRQLEQWLQAWDAGKPKKKAAFLYGPPGVGKTSIVQILAEKYDYDLILLDASHWRTKGAIDKILGSASQQHALFHKSRLFVLDELEGMSGSQDRGGMRAVTDLIKHTLYPMIFIGNDVWNRKFSSLRNKCVMIKFQRIPLRSIIAKLRAIGAAEGIKIEEEALQIIAEKAQGDLRSAITDLQTLSQHRTTLRPRDVAWFAHRDRHEAIFSVLNRLFSAKTFWEARRTVEIADVHYDMLFEWIYENVPYQLSSLKELNHALDALTRADIYFKRVRTYQAWKLLKYAFDQMTVGVTSAKRTADKRWVAFKFPQRIRVMAKTRTKRRLRKEIGMKLSKPLHMSSDAVIQEVLPYLKIILNNDASASKAIITDLDLDEKMIRYLKAE